MRRAAAGVFLILWSSYAFFWHGRDWNTASRLMLVYAVVEHGTIRLDGLDDQTGDKAFYNLHYYSDKLPGYSFAAALPFAVVKEVFRLPDHPLGARGFAHWPADYAVTLLTSGLATAATGTLLVLLAGSIGCGPGRAALVGLAYGLATPAYAYATLAYGHQLASACLLGAFACLRRGSGWTMALAGFLAAYASAVELQVGPVSAILGCYAVLRAVRRGQSPRGLVAFGIGALVPTLSLLAYNWFAFDSPLRMGYFFHATRRFAEVHSPSNPLGLRPPDWSRLDDLAVLPARGLLWYAPIVAMAAPGLFALASRRQVATAVVSAATMAAVLLVNLSYPEWSGGFSTGPRLLVTLLPFAMLPVAGLLAVNWRWLTWLAGLLGLAGGIVVMLFQGVGARVPDPMPAVPPGFVDPLARPLTDAVWPVWRGDPLPGWSYGHRFARNLVSVARPGWVASLSPGRQWLQFVPLWVAQGVAIGGLFVLVRPRPVRPLTSPPPPGPVA